MLFRRQPMMMGQNYFIPYQPRPRINWGVFLNNAQRTLDVVNSALPLVYQLGPILKNAGTMLRIYSELKSDESKNTTSTPINIRENNTEGPTFFQ